MIDGITVECELLDWYDGPMMFKHDNRIFIRWFETRNSPPPNWVVYISSEVDLDEYDRLAPMTYEDEEYGTRLYTMMANGKNHSIWIEDYDDGMFRMGEVDLNEILEGYLERHNAAKEAKRNNETNQG